MYTRLTVPIQQGNVHLSEIKRTNIAREAKSPWMKKAAEAWEI